MSASFRSLAICTRDAPLRKSETIRPSMTRKPYGRLPVHLPFSRQPSCHCSTRQAIDADSARACSAKNAMMARLPGLPLSRCSLPKMIRPPAASTASSISPTWRIPRRDSRSSAGTIRAFNLAVDDNLDGLFQVWEADVLLAAREAQGIELVARLDLETVGSRRLTIHPSVGLRAVLVQVRHRDRDPPEGCGPALGRVLILSCHDVPLTHKEVRLERGCH